MPSYTNTYELVKDFLVEGGTEVAPINIEPNFGGGTSIYDNLVQAVLNCSVLISQLVGNVKISLTAVSKLESAPRTTFSVEFKIKAVDGPASMQLFRTVVDIAGLSVAIPVPDIQIIQQGWRHNTSVDDLSLVENASYTVKGTVVVEPDPE